MYYEVPTQVIFRENEEASDSYAGIAYGEGVICGCCGSTFILDEVEIIQELPWANIQEAIRG